ncbi:Cubilin 460 kDa receptor [Collichthys lucidus]|uniref:Cubilin 460 kDa receptor n=1 Tax=Collichthys lucidus TaxID=240159 RepID=A0A4U5VJ03_COLLU|nr:Cubilin 460 kDa receptor [Collichthys lucidus]
MPIGFFGSPDPNLDGRYEPRMDCLWIIDMPVNRAVNLTFNSFKLESSSTCRHDFVKTLTSPSFPGAYPPHTSCRWIVDAAAQETIRVSVQTFVLQPSQSCSTNYLEMKDWPMGDYGQSHKFCASDGNPLDFYSYSRTILVHFRSDSYMTGNGLSFTYQIVSCSRTYEQDYGFLKSPGWPDIYPHNMDCTIILKAQQNSYISFFFNNFDVESHSNCEFDYLEIRNGSTANSPLIGRFCGSTLPSPIFPQSNLLYLRFKSDFSHARDGFEATWTSSPHGQN